MVVPKEFTPPAKVKRCAPVSALPILIAKGFATICCTENPKPTINKADKKNTKLAFIAAGTNRKAPIAEITKPKERVFL